MKKRFNLVSNLTHRTFYILAAIIILGAIVIEVHASTIGLLTPLNPGHNSSQIFIPVSGGYITLQDAINYGYFVGATINIPKTPLPTRSPYETADKVLLTRGGYNVTLQDFIDHGLFSSPANAGAYSRGNTIPVGGEYAGRINVSTGSGFKTLQNVVDIDINLLSLCPSLQHFDGSQCVLNVGQSCSPTGLSANCISGFTIQNDGSCGGGSNLAWGTSCGSGVGCDGTGHCVGYSGSNCGSCPFGTGKVQDCGNPNTVCLSCPGGQSTCNQPWGGYYWRGGVMGPVCGYTYGCGLSGSCSSDVSWSVYPGESMNNPGVRLC